jgi:hypothetical protein
LAFWRPIAPPYRDQPGPAEPGILGLAVLVLPVSSASDRKTQRKNSGSHHWLPEFVLVAFGALAIDRQRTVADDAGERDRARGRRAAEVIGEEESTAVVIAISVYPEDCHIEGAH